MRIAFVTFGCRLNHSEALKLEAEYANSGWEIVTPNDAPDRIIVRGCSVTHKAQHDSEKTISQLIAANPTAEVIVTGCLPNAQKTNLTPKTTSLHNPLVHYRASRAYLKIQDGCAGHCAFCIVPSFRGSPNSKPIEHILQEAQEFLDTGFREIVITGCNLVQYYDHGLRLWNVLDKLAPLLEKYKARLRLGSLEPGIDNTNLVKTCEFHHNICPFLHLSIQSASNTILKRMCRPYTIETVEKTIGQFRAIYRERLNVGADIITGFPGESEQDFLQTFNFLKHLQITNLHVFPYSERPGTLAATMKPVIPERIRFERAKILENLANINRTNFIRNFIGKTVEVCVEKNGDGWCAEYIRCHFEHPIPEHRREIISAIVCEIDNKTGSLYCRPKT